MSYKTTLCVTCRATFTNAELEGATCCPSCGTLGIPAALNNTATVTLTGHEWRLLTIWADNWARKICAKDELPGYDSVAAIGGVIGEIHRQAPSLGGLTMSEEIQELADHLGTEIEQSVDGERTTVKPVNRH